MNLLQTIRALDAPYVVWLTPADLFRDLGMDAAPYSVDALFEPETIGGLRALYYVEPPRRSPLHDLIGFQRTDPSFEPAEIDAAVGVLP